MRASIRVRFDPKVFINHLLSNCIVITRSLDPKIRTDSRRSKVRRPTTWRILIGKFKRTQFSAEWPRGGLVLDDINSTKTFIILHKSKS